MPRYPFQPTSMTATVTMTMILSLACHFLHSSAIHRPSSEDTGSEALGAVQAVVLSLSQHGCPLLFLMSNAKQTTTDDVVKRTERMPAPQGIAFFLVPRTDNLQGNTTQTHLRAMIDKVRLMGQLWRCLELVVVSDDPTFLATFAHLSLRRHALKWSTRILVLTRLPLTHLGGLHRLLSSRNAMLLLPHRDKNSVRSVGVYVAAPYSSASTHPRRVATWTTNTTWTNTLQQLFPEKFSVFTSAPTLTLAIELVSHHTITKVPDPRAPEGYRIVYTGIMAEVVKYLAKAMNFTYRYALSPDRTFGTKQPDGSWTGMMGMVVKQEVDFAVGPFMLSPVQGEAGDYTGTFSAGYIRMVGGLGDIKIDPWGFLLPLKSDVWASTVMALLWLLLVLKLISSCLPSMMVGSGYWSAIANTCVRVILQQNIGLCGKWWWWERLMLGVWMLATLVLTKSYASNLMSLLAVRYVPQPFQTVRDVLDDPHAVMIWEKYSRNEQFLRQVQCGVFREVAELEGKGRLLFHTPAQFHQSLVALVRAGGHVFVNTETALQLLVSEDVSKKGRCDYYISKEGFLPFSTALLSQKTNPIIQGLNPRMMMLWEAGLTRYWFAMVPNITRCNRVPKKVLVTTTFSTTNLSGVFAVLAVGLAVGITVWCAELLVTSGR